MTPRDAAPRKKRKAPRAYRVRCHLCMTDFAVPIIPRDDSAWTVYERIIQAHHAVTPGCQGGPDELQILRGRR